MDLSARSDEDLIADVAKLTGSHRELTSKLVAHLAEIEERRLHLLRGFSSMFDFCTNELRFSVGEAFRRILAARLSRRFPVVLALLASGSVNLSTLELLREWLTDENHAELFAAAGGKSKCEIQALVAARFPRPDRPSRIRGTTSEPLSAARFSIEFTASETLRKKLELCCDLMSHANPSRDLAPVIERAVDLLFADLERKRLGKITRPQGVADTHHGNPQRVANAQRGNPTNRTDAPHQMSSHVARITRRKVFERDGIRCTYVSKAGRRCGARAFLELDHVYPKALGGSNDSGNLRVLCRGHNQLLAEQAFGREHVSERRHFRQQKSTGRPHELPNAYPPTANPLTVSSTKPEPTTATLAGTTAEKVRRALRGLGFRDGEARRAVAAVMSAHDPSEPLALERTLREAILVATAA